MEATLPWLQGLIAFQCLLFVAYLAVGKRLDGLANRINLAFLLVLTLHMLANLLMWLKPVPPLVALSWALGLCYGPLILVYLQSLVYRQYRWRPGHWWHFVPAALIGLTAAVVDLPVELAAGSIFASLAVYLGLSMVVLRRFRRVLADTHSAQDLIAMDWAWGLLRLSALILLINILSTVLQWLYGPVPLALLAEIALFLMLLLLASSFIFKGLLQPQLFLGLTEEELQISAQRQRRPSANELEPERQAAIHRALLAHMQQRKPHLDPLLSLTSLSRQLGESPRHLSQTINAREAMSFSDFINAYRIEEAKRQLAAAASDRSILEILFDCGFSTKSNFNRAFKQQVGMTPSEYRAAQLARPATSGH